MKTRAVLLLGVVGLLGPRASAGELRLDRFSYEVDGLKIEALVCRPDDREGRPLLNFVHGGLDTKMDVASCRRFAARGWVVAQSALRGQDGSDGTPELCGGEVNDVLALRRLVEGRYRTDRRRVAYLGVSFGGCVALKAAARDRDVRAVVTLLGPTDFARQHALLRRVRPESLPAREALVGGSPAEVPEAYESRRPISAARRLPAPLLTVAAGRDPLVALAESCEVRDARRTAGREVVEVRQKSDGSPAELPERSWRRCPGERPAATLPPLRGRDVLLIYDDLHHTSTPRMWRVAADFLSANRAPPTVFERISEFFRRLF